MQPIEQGSSTAAVPAVNHDGHVAPATSAVDAGTAEARADFITFYDREYRDLVVFLLCCGANLQGAEDAAQEAFVEAWILIERGSWTSIKQPRGWIRTVALRKHMRPAGRRRSPLLVFPVAEYSEVQPFPDFAELTAGTELVLDALRSLPAELRAVTAFMLDGFTSREVATLLGLTCQQVRDRRKKARKILAVNLAELSDYDRER